MKNQVKIPAFPRVNIHDNFKITPGLYMFTHLKLHTGKDEKILCSFGK